MTDQDDFSDAEVEALADLIVAFEAEAKARHEAAPPTQALMPSDESVVLAGMAAERGIPVSRIVSLASDKGGIVIQIGVLEHSQATLTCEQGGQLVLRARGPGFPIPRLVFIENEGEAFDLIDQWIVDSETPTTAAPVERVLAVAGDAKSNSGDAFSVTGMPGAEFLDFLMRTPIR